MKAFWIFAACLTAAYLIYYTVTILRDLYGKPKEESHDEVESFELKDVPVVASKAVEETDGGFRVSKDTGTGNQPAWEETMIRAAVKEAVQPEAPKIDASGSRVDKTKEQIKAAQSEMDDVVPKMSHEMTASILETAITAGESKVPINREIVPAEPDKTESAEENGKGQAI